MKSIHIIIRTAISSCLAALVVNLHNNSDSPKQSSANSLKLQ